MNREQTMVEEFHKTFDILINDSPTLLDPTSTALRVSLIQEEFDEYAKAVYEDDLVEAADALGDLLYVIYGAAVSHGIDMESVFAEVHRSNMTKVGGHKAPNGKWIKPDTYEPARIAQVVMQQKLSKTEAGKEAFAVEGRPFDTPPCQINFSHHVPGTVVDAYHRPTPVTVPIPDDLNPNNTINS